VRVRMVIPQGRQDESKDGYTPGEEDESKDGNTQGRHDE